MAGRSRPSETSDEDKASRDETVGLGAEDDDESRCMEIVRRVVDEETALEMVSAFLMITQDHRVPPTASIHFHSCYFDPISGGTFMINIYSSSV